MSWRNEKTAEGQDLVFDGVENGIGVSPLKGIANIQNANISTETGEILASYSRTAQQQIPITDGTLTASPGDGAYLFAAPATLKAGTWITISSTDIADTVGTCDYLVVGGGGGGGGANQSAGGGGGAGGMLTGSTTPSIGAHTITVGAGGTAGPIDDPGGDGEDSSFGVIAVADGGGGGGSGTAPDQAGRNGGSGGGGGGGAASAGGTAVVGEGNDGGTGNSTTNNTGGGGGGKGAVGANGAASQGGNGGAGTASSISGASVTYAGGGGGGAEAGAAGTGGSGGGGAGGLANAAGTAGTANTGGGGGGAGETGGGAGQTGGAGGSGIVIISYATGTIVATGGAITTSGGNTIHTFTSSGTFTVYGFGTGNWYVSYKDTSNRVKLSPFYDPYSLYPIPHGTSGTATFSTLTTIGAPLAKATEQYLTDDSVEYRYYILDDNSYIWVYDTQVYDSSLVASGVGITWMLPDPDDHSAAPYTGIGVLNGWLFALNVTNIHAKPTVNLGTNFTRIRLGDLVNPFRNHINFCYTGTQGKMFYTDGNFIGEIFPNTSLETGVANVQSYARYTGGASTSAIDELYSGSTPYPEGGGTRIPAVFFTDDQGTLPTAITAQTVYYIDYFPSTETFAVYAAITGGSTLDMAAGAGGNQYFNTFYPLGDDAGAGGTDTTMQLTTQRVNLPTYEVSQCIVELGNTVLIGCNGNVVYSWNQVDATPSEPIFLPESNVTTMINVNNMGYVFAGNRGNIYITNNSVASLVLKVPDYCAGVPNSQLTYIEPNFTWGDADYIRGRVYFSILDQTATKAGNCGGIWSFVPTQNFYVGQDIGMALRLENQNSYGDYDGYAPIIIANEEQDAGTAPQYWAAWQDSYDTATANFGIDYTATTPVTSYVIETDLLSTGTLLNKTTFTQLEYKLTTPLETGDSVQLYWRKSSTDAWTSAGTTKQETADPISGYYDMSFQKTQYLQFRAVATTPGTTASSFVRLSQIRLR